MNLNNYWSKKNPEIASQIFKKNLINNKIILDPFLGSGTSLEGIKTLNFNVKFVGVELNQMPIEYAKYNINKPNLENLLKAKKDFLNYYEKNKLFYNFSHKNEKFELEKVILNFPNDDVEVKSFIFLNNKNKKINLNKENNPTLFNKFRLLYIKRSKELKRKKKIDLLLDENSRIAIKSKMNISDIYGPITFYLLQQTCDNFKDNNLIKVIISSILHLTKYTDLRSQSQFPYWFPKKNAMERNIFILILKKINSLIKNYKSDNYEIEKKNSFSELNKASKKSYILFNKPIQNIGLDIPNQSIDLVFTDPPYFDQVAYSEYLAIWEFFLGYKKNNSSELIQTNRKKKIIDKKTYLLNLKRCFQVIADKMKINSKAIIYFKDSKLNNINDFLKILSECGINFEKQIHINKKKYTYKQNTTQETTVVGDSLFFFIKDNKMIKIKEKIFNKKEIEKIVLEFTKKYISNNNFAKIGEILDNGLIRKLFLEGYLGKLKDAKDILDILKKKYTLDKKKRTLIEI